MAKNKNKQNDAVNDAANVESTMNKAPVSVDDLSEDAILEMFHESEGAIRKQGNAKISAHDIREKFIKPIFARTNMEKVSVAQICKTVNLALAHGSAEELAKTPAKERVQVQAIRGAAGAHYIATIDGITYVYQYMVNERGEKLSDAEVQAIMARKRNNIDVDAAVKQAAAELTDDDLLNQ